MVVDIEVEIDMTNYLMCLKNGIFSDSIRVVDIDLLGSNTTENIVQEFPASKTTPILYNYYDQHQSRTDMRIPLKAWNLMRNGYGLVEIDKFKSLLLTDLDTTNGIKTFCDFIFSKKIYTYPIPNQNGIGGMDVVLSEIPDLKCYQEVHNGDTYTTMLNPDGYNDAATTYFFKSTDTYIIDTLRAWLNFLFEREVVCKLQTMHDLLSLDLSMLREDFKGLDIHFSDEVMNDKTLTVTSEMFSDDKSHLLPKLQQSIVIGDKLRHEIDSFEISYHTNTNTQLHSYSITFNLKGFRNSMPSMSKGYDRNILTKFRNILKLNNVYMDSIIIK